MYRCYDSRKLRLFLILDAIALAVWLVCSAAVKAAPQQTEGVFLPVIMYHSITDHGKGDYQLSPAQFEDDLRYLKSHGYETVSVAELVAYTEGNGTLPAQPVMLTFDDGFYNNLSTALPLLERYDMCAVVSVVGRYTEELAPADPHVDRYSYLTWEDVSALLASGRVEIGSHTYDLHRNDERAGCSIRVGEDADAYAQMLCGDLTQLQALCSEKTGCTPTVFAYPYGFICRESIPVLQELGFVCTLTCYEAPNYITRDSTCLYGLSRYNRAPGHSSEEFFGKVLNQAIS
ncbi:MAG: polysaccharide deacetylase family protein [Oscillospiraceae bacterium]|nr:polysaccharide deacetylase family protein [Oscillospiraceae bacterium]